MLTTVKTKPLLNLFVKLPAALYRDDPNWVKPLVGHEVSDFLPGSNPVLRHLDMELYLAGDTEKPVGRVAAFTDRRYNLQQGDTTAFFGFFECARDPAAARELLQAVEDFACRKKACRVLGPVDFSTNYQAGLLVEGWQRPTVMTPYNKKYYPEYMLMAEFSKIMDLYAYTFHTKTGIPAKAEHLTGIIKIRNPRVSVKPLCQLSPSRMVTLLTDLYNRCFLNNWGFVPITTHEFANLAGNIASWGRKAVNLIALDGSRPVGLLLTVPDLYMAAAPGGPRSSPAKMPPRLRLTVLGVLPTHRNRGIETLLGVQALREAAQIGYSEVELSVILENNNPMNNLIKRRLGLSADRTFRVYQKPVRHPVHPDRGR